MSVTKFRWVLYGLILIGVILAFAPNPFSTVPREEFGSTQEDGALRSTPSAPAPRNANGDLPPSGLSSMPSGDTQDTRRTAPNSAGKVQVLPRNDHATDPAQVVTGTAQIPQTTRVRAPAQVVRKRPPPDLTPNATTPPVTGSKPGTFAMSGKSEIFVGTKQLIRTPNVKPRGRTVAASEQRIAVQNSLYEFQRKNRFFPAGENAEIVKQLLAKDPSATMIEQLGGMLNDKQELVDVWGKPYFIHTDINNRLEVRSSGPDGLLFSDDDLYE